MERVPKNKYIISNNLFYNLKYNYIKYKYVKNININKIQNIIYNYNSLQNEVYFR